ncbi:MAG TPA: hypothetical protein VH144_00835, partial [Candidatus Saccharimonadales bacterium]|nr:hypothetical protein [Candidatus Saccharimonadales bacterium]
MNENLFPSEPVRDPQLTERIDHFQQRIIKELYDQKIDVASYAMQLEAINNVASTLEHELTNLADWAARFDIDGPT